MNSEVTIQRAANGWIVSAPSEMTGDGRDVYVAEDGGDDLEGEADALLSALAKAFPLLSTYIHRGHRGHTKAGDRAIGETLSLGKAESRVGELAEVTGFDCLRGVEAGQWVVTIRRHDSDITIVLSDIGGVALACTSADYLLGLPDRDTTDGLREYAVEVVKIVTAAACDGGPDESVHLDGRTRDIHRRVDQLCWTASRISVGVEIGSDRVPRLVRLDSDDPDLRRVRKVVASALWATIEATR